MLSSQQQPIPVNIVPRRMFDMDNLLTSLPRNPLSLLDIFDPFDQLDQALSRELAWLDRPETMQLPRDQPMVPHRYRITLDCSGFRPETIKTELKDLKGRQVLRIVGLDERGNRASDNYTKKEMKRCFTLPRGIEHDKMVSFMTPSGQLVIEFPLERVQRDQPERSTKAILPQVVDVRGGGKEVRVRFPLPDTVSLDKVHVSLKDRDLIMRVEDKTVTDGSITRVHLYDRCTLPDNTDWSSLKCVREKEHLTVSAPILWDVTKPKSHEIPIQMSSREAKRDLEPMSHKERKKKEDRKKSLSPERKKKEDLSPERKKSLSPEKKKKDISPARKEKSKERKKSLSPVRKDKSKERKKSLSPVRKEKSKERKKSLSPERKKSLSPEKKKDISPARKKRDVSPLTHETLITKKDEKKKDKSIERQWEGTHVLPTPEQIVGKKKDIHEKEHVVPKINKKKKKKSASLHDIDVSPTRFERPIETTKKKDQEKRKEHRKRSAEPIEPGMRIIPVETILDPRRPLSPKRDKSKEQRSQLLSAM